MEEQLQRQLQASRAAQEGLEQRVRQECELRVAGEADVARQRQWIQSIRADMHEKDHAVHVSAAQVHLLLLCFVPAFCESLFVETSGAKYLALHLYNSYIIVEQLSPEALLAVSLSSTCANFALCRRSAIQHRGFSLLSNIAQGQHHQHSAPVLQRLCLSP